MPTQGQILHKPVTGDTYEFLESARDTDGARVVMKATIEGRGKMLPDHMHMPQNEFYEIISGTMTVWQDRKLSQLPTGEKVPLARGRPRNHYNDADTLLTYIHSVTPALDVSS